MKAKGINSSDKDPWLMALLSFLILGLGQLILGQTAKGLTILVVGIIIGIITFGIASLITVPISVIDAYLIAKKKIEGKEVGDWEFF